MYGFFRGAAVFSAVRSRVVQVLHHTDRTSQTHIRLPRMPAALPMLCPEPGCQGSRREPARRRTGNGQSESQSGTAGTSAAKGQQQSQSQEAASKAKLGKACSQPCACGRRASILSRTAAATTIQSRTAAATTTQSPSGRPPSLQGSADFVSSERALQGSTGVQGSAGCMSSGSALQGSTGVQGSAFCWRIDPLSIA